MATTTDVETPHVALPVTSSDHGPNPVLTRVPRQINGIGGWVSCLRCTDGARGVVRRGKRGEKAEEGCYIKCPPMLPICYRP